MLLRASIVMLVMLNLGAAGWWAFRPEARRAAPAADAAKSLRLLEESSPPMPAIATQSAIPPAPASPAPAATPTQATADVPAAPVCLRFGPFADAAAREVARATLQGIGAQATAHDVPARGVRGWKVFLPAQPSREAAQALAEKLKASGISDLFVMAQGEDANSIALGRFSSEAGARHRQTELQGKGVQARVEPIGGTPAQAWLDARLPANADRVALAKLAPAQPLDCARLR
ncbi:SPOR domain-containing protein [Thermomonas brevis]|uniref:SPOR domain-containing protein n=1 Tax=Thermomonas brevis TaxID=215691 RepID=A0A7G9QQ78_9GAMM|nr:SPOR domain-containing protein [Thermomonas brevis]QNN45503.1 SPOR domain-containing protein [Thermomonas brevis]